MADDSKRFTLSEFDDLLADLEGNISQMGTGATEEKAASTSIDTGGDSSSSEDEKVEFTTRNNNVKGTFDIDKELSELEPVAVPPPPTKVYVPPPKPKVVVAQRPVAPRPSVTIATPPPSSMTSPPPPRSEKVEMRKSRIVQAPRSGGHVCASCGSQLSGEYLAAMGRFWHKACFRCRTCGNPLGEGQFFEDQRSGDAFCPSCITNKYVCANCRRGIIGPYVSFSDGRLMHPECLPTSACPRCGRAVSGNQIEAMDKIWHPECFACSRCNAALVGDFMKLDGKPYCANCVQVIQQEQNSVGVRNRGLTCYSCRRVITDGEYIGFGENQSIHRGCFVCHKCRATLDPSAFYNVSGKLHCDRCVPQQ